MNNWISDGIKSRHWICNTLLGIMFVPLVLLDIFFCIVFLADGGLKNGFIVAEGLIAAIGAYGLVLRNRTNGFWLGCLAVFTLITAICIDDVAYYDFEYGMGWSFFEKIVRCLIDTIKYTFISLAPPFLVLLIKKNGVPALKNLEYRGIFIRQRYELIIAFFISFTYLATHIWQVLKP